MKTITPSELNQIRKAIIKAIAEKKGIDFIKKEVKKTGTGFPNFCFSPELKMITFDKSIIVDFDGFTEKKKIVRL